MQQFPDYFPKLPDYDKLMADSECSGNRPVVHPNGFIQLHINDRLRAHFWHPLFKERQQVVTPIHDHTFSFTSYLYSGLLVNLTYKLDDQRRGSRPYIEYVVDGGILVKKHSFQDIPKWLLAGRADVVQPGQCYYMEKGVFHSVMYDVPSISIMVKRESIPFADPTVLVPQGLEPDNQFRRDQCNADDLWEVIRDCFGYM